MRKYLFVLLLFLIIPTMVYADGAGPSTIGYDAVIINKKGAIDSENKTAFKYNTKVHVYNEIEGEVYACGISNVDDCNYISIDDIAPLKEEILPEDLLKSDEIEEYKNKIIVINKKGVKLKKGPANIYGDYDKVIPYNTVLTTTYSGQSTDWMYVDSDEYKGWIDYDYAAYVDNSFITYTAIKMYDMVTDKEIATIPQETIIKSYYWTYYNELDYCFFEYNGNFGYIKDDTLPIGYKFEEESEFRLLTKTITNIKSNGKNISSIPTGELVIPLYSGECINDDVCLYYVDYKGIKGLIDQNNIIEIESSARNKSYNKDLVMYNQDYVDDFSKKEFTTIEEFNKNHELGVVVPEDTTIIYYKEFTRSYHDLEYFIDLIKYNGKIGFVITDINNYNSDITPSPIPKQEKEIEKEENKYFVDKTTDIIIYCIISAIILAATAVVTILVVNSKKKNKQVEKPKIEEKKKVVKEETKPKSSSTNKSKTKKTNKNEG